MNICVISDGYPSDKYMDFPFVKELCEAWAKIGHNVSVIAPQSLTKALIRRTGLFPVYTKVQTEEYLGKIEIYRPNYISLGNFGEKHLNLCKLRDMAINSTLNKLKTKPDIIYGHFWHSGYSGYKYANKHHIPIFVASGESVINFSIDSTEKKRFADTLNGIICVSTKNKKESIQKKLTDGKNCIVIPNAINKSIFKKYPKDQVRKELGFGINDFIVAFVGWFIPRKGPDRVAKALSMAKDESIKALFIGSAKDGVEVVPDYKGSLFVGSVEHHNIPKYLSAADLFVLPTLQEGCCNAIIEAMSCGLPIISSDLEFNYDIIDEKNSILIDPLDEQQICDAIVTLKNDKQRIQRMSEESIAKVKQSSIENRAASIIEFIHRQTTNIQ